jgi:hypothetical protein
MSSAMFFENAGDMDLGVFLAEKKLITPDQLRTARDTYKNKGGYFSQRLIELGYINETSLTTLLTCHYGYSYLPLKAYTIDDNALRMIPATIAWECLVMPIEINDKLLTVSMADPLNKGVVEILRQTTHCEIIIFISARAEILEALTKYYGDAAPFVREERSTDSALRDDLNIPYVSNGRYAGPNRRRFRRFTENIDVDCYLYPNVLKTKSINVSLGGVLLESKEMLTPGTQVALSVRVRHSQEVRGVAEVLRCEPRPHGHTFEVGAFFNFLPKCDHEILSQHLLSKLSR